jgi:hypothetical protein
MMQKCGLKKSYGYAVADLQYWTIAILHLSARSDIKSVGRGGHKKSAKALAL